MSKHELYFSQLAAQRNALRQAKRQLWLGAVAVWAMLVGIAALVLVVMELIR